MKKLFLTLFVAFEATTVLWASNVITYTATSKLSETREQWSNGIYTTAFNTPISSHTFSNGTGTITFDGEVITIGNNAFCRCIDLTSITIPNSVTSIGDNAFNDCSGLTSVTIPNSVATIGNNAFQYCYNLISVAIPNSVTAIGYQTFCCSGLTSVTIPNSVTTIGGYAFQSCDRLTSVTIPNSITTIGEGAFSDCSGLTSVTIGNSVTTIGKGAFKDCNRVTSVTINSNAIMNAVSNPTYRMSNIFGNQVKKYIIGSSVTSIGNYAFQKCCSLTSITIPNSVTSIGNRAFDYCDSLPFVTIPNSVTTIGDEAFRDCSSLTKTNYMGTIADWCKIKFGGYYSNPMCYSHNFYINDVEVKDLVIPEGVTTIGGSAFNGCSGLTSVTIPNSVTTIGSSTFDGCSGLTSVTIPNSITTIGNYAFEGCRGIKSVTWNAKNCNGYNFGSQVETFVFGDSVEVIPANVCQNMAQLTSIIIPNSVTTIGSSAFWGCSGLTSITIPSSVQSIENSAFKNCTRISELNINDGLTAIGGSAFYGLSNKNLKEITLPNSVKTIGKYAFADCSYLKTIILGAKLEDIDEYAFQNDERLLYVNCYAEEPPVLQENAFDNYDIYLQVPCDVLDEYKVAKGWKLFNRENVSCLSAEGKTVTGDEVIVTPSTTEATFVWPSNDQADSYSLEITKDSDVFCTLKFNANGQLTGIAFAPGRGEAHTMPAATMTTNGWQFTVTGLNQASKYAYTMDVTDASQKSIKTYTGEFVTNGYTGLETVDGSQCTMHNVKFIKDGRLLIEHNGIVYDAHGARVK